MYQCMGLIKFEDFDTYSDENNSPSSGNLFLSPFSDTMDIVFECRRRRLRGKIRLCRKGGRFCHHPSHTRTVKCGYVKKLGIRVQFINQYLRSSLRPKHKHRIYHDPHSFHTVPPILRACLPLALLFQFCDFDYSAIFTSNEEAMSLMQTSGSRGRGKPPADTWIG